MIQRYIKDYEKPLRAIRLLLWNDYKISNIFLQVPDQA